jgi:hypothetical protein
MFVEFDYLPFDACNEVDKYFRFDATQLVHLRETDTELRATYNRAICGDCNDWITFDALNRLVYLCETDTEPVAIYQRGIQGYTADWITPEYDFLILYDEFKVQTFNDKKNEHLATAFGPTQEIYQISRK